MLIKNNFKILAIILLVSVNLVIAEDGKVEDPVSWVQNITSRVLSTLRSNQAAIRNNPDRIYQIVDQQILPSVDFDEMARWVAGRNAWNQAGASERQNFIREFKRLVITTYAHTLNEFANEKISFLPLRQDYSVRKRIEVSSLVTQKNKPQQLRVNFRLIRQNGSWRVYDLVVEGISLLKGYQSQFSNDIKGKGLNYVTNKIKTHNYR